MVFSSTIDKVDWNTRLVTGDAVAEITRLKTEDGGPMSIGGATLAGAAMRAGLIDEIPNAALRLPHAPDLMDREHTTPLNAPTTAAAPMSPSHLSHQFRTAYGETPYS